MDALWRLDQQLFREINQGWRNDWLDPIFLIFSYTGLGAVISAIILCLLFAKAGRKYVLPLLVAEGVSGLLICDVIKNYVVPRDRPSNLSYSIIQEKFFANSFPSGHTSSAFGVALMLVLMTRKTNKAWVGWLATSWASLVGLSRIYRGVHWPTDVLAGVFVGLAGATLTYLVFDHFGWTWQPEAPTVQTQS